MRIIISLSILYLLLNAMMSCRNRNADSHFFGALEEVGYPVLLDSNVVLMDESVFKEAEILKGEYVEIEPIIKPEELTAIIKGDYLLIKHLEQAVDAPLLHILKLPAMELVAELAKKGNGPDEFLDIRLIETTDEDKYCFIYDLPTGKICYIDKKFKLHLYQKKNTLENMSEISLGENMIHVNDQKFLIEQRADDGAGLFFLDFNSMIVKGVINLNCSSNLNRNWADDWTCFLGNLCFNSRKKRFAYTYDFYHRVIFADIDGNNQKIIQFEEQDPFKSNDMWEHMNTGKDTYYYICSFISSNFAYFVYRGSNFDDEPNPTLYLEQWTWDGEPVKRYELEKGLYPLGGCVDEVNSTIYLLDKTKDDFLYRVKMEKKNI